MSSNYAERRKKLEEAAKETRCRRWRTARRVLLAGILVGLAIGLTVHYWPDPQKATLQTVADTDSQDWLFRIATEHGNRKVQQAALEKIHDEEILARIAMLDTRASKQVALRITQPELLANLAVGSKSPWARYIGILKTRDQDVLLRSVQADPLIYGYCREAAIHRLRDKALLKKLATEAEHPRLRWAAAKTLDDRDVLLKCILSLSQWTQGRVHRLVNQRVLRFAREGDVQALVSIALHADSKNQRFGALKQIDDPVIVATVLRKHPALADDSILRKVTDQPTLAWFAQHGKDRNQRQGVIRRLTDQAILAKLVRTDPDERIRKSALARMTDQTRLESQEKARRGDPPPAKRMRSIQAIDIEKIHDPQELMRLAAFDLKRSVRVAASRKVTDPKILVKLIRSDEATSVRPVSVKLALLACGNERELAREALSRLANQKQLEYVVNQASMGYIRVLAARKITEPQRADRLARTYSDDYQVVEALVPHMADREMLIGLATQDIRLGAAEARLAQLDQANPTGR